MIVDLTPVVPSVAPPSALSPPVVTVTTSITTTYTVIASTITSTILAVIFFIATTIEGTNYYDCTY